MGNEEGHNFTVGEKSLEEKNEFCQQRWIECDRKDDGNPICHEEWIECIKGKTVESKVATPYLLAGDSKNDMCSA